MRKNKAIASILLTSLFILSGSVKASPEMNLLFNNSADYQMEITYIWAFDVWDHPGQPPSLDVRTGSVTLPNAKSGKNFVDLCVKENISHAPSSLHSDFHVTKVVVKDDSGKIIATNEFLPTEELQRDGIVVDTKGRQECRVFNRDNYNQEDRWNTVTVLNSLSDSGYITCNHETVGMPTDAPSLKTR